ncbi:MAG TPA: hypothetical protein VMU69_25020, partial [Bradyrhizobium sp.]|nr:hypothetical protein [Bradyrhizobium sp.]
MGALAIAIIKKAGDRRAQIPERQNASTGSRRRGLTQFLIQATLGISHAFTKRARCRKWVTLPILPNSKPSQRRPVHYNVLFGFAAVGAFLLALPAAAMACVNSCPGGTVGVNLGGFPFCQGGANNGQLVCTLGPMASTLPYESYHYPFVMAPFDPFWFLVPKVGNDPWNDEDSPEFFKAVGHIINANSPYGGVSTPNQLGGPVSVKMFGQSDAGDPDVIGNITSIHDSGGSLSDSAGAIAGSAPIPGYHELSYGGGVTATWNGSRLLPTNQQFFLDGTLAYNHNDADYNASALTSGTTRQ